MNGLSQIDPRDRFQINLLAAVPPPQIPNGRRTLLEKAVVPTLVAVILAVAGWFAIHLSAQIREVRAEMGTVRAELGEVRGRLDGVDRRIDDLRTDINSRLAGIEAALRNETPSRGAGP